MESGSFVSDAPFSRLFGKRMKFENEEENENESERTFRNFFRGGNESFCDFSLPSSPPKWLDRDLYQDGVKCFWDNIFMVFISMCQSLIGGLSIPNLR